MIIPHRSSLISHLSLNSAGGGDLEVGVIQVFRIGLAEEGQRKMKIALPPGLGVVEVERTVGTEALHSVSISEWNE